MLKIWLQLVEKWANFVKLHNWLCLKCDMPISYFMAKSPEEKWNFKHGFIFMAKHTHSHTRLHGITEQMHNRVIEEKKQAKTFQNFI